jgi:DNA-binding transcriptional MerR regulator
MSKLYRVREFAALAGVTVRTLHHYERIGLLKPRRTGAGYRVYSAADLRVLEQIVALKFIGIPLRQIHSLIRHGAGALAGVLAAQRLVLDERKRLLERAITAIEQAETAIERGLRDPDALKRIIEVIEMQNDNTRWQSQYDALVRGKIERLEQMTPETKAVLHQRWNELFADVGRALGEDPSSTTAQALATRWLTLLEGFGGVIDPGAAKRFAPAYQGSTPPFGDARVWQFIGRALAVRA